jgi:hypothetical protein
MRLQVNNVARTYFKNTLSLQPARRIKRALAGSPKFFERRRAGRESKKQLNTPEFILM